jgi:hypothetical protein
MASITESPVSQFRSNVQWFLEGNTPSHQAELIVDLLVGLRTLSADFVSRAGDESQRSSILKECSESLGSVSRKDLQDTNKLKSVVSSLEQVVALEDKGIVTTKAFRDVIVQLIVVAESHPDLPFRRAVLELTQRI